MPPYGEAVVAVGIGLGVAAALFVLAAWLADRRADRESRDSP